MNHAYDELTFEEFEARKRANRERLNILPVDEAQAKADSILQPRLWHVVDPRELAWPGDLADEDFANNSSSGDSNGDDRN